MLAPDTVLQNRYIVARLLAEGGMGAVYLARDQRLGHTVALKETFFNTDMLRKAFEREARLLAGLRHSALPKVSDHFTEGAGQFLVMEFIPGDDLGEMLQRRGSAFPPDQVLSWADQLLDALDYLHSQQPPVIHRDIKPQNLKLTERGQIILLDFGLAKGLSSQGMEATTGRSIFGYTPDYAPLEQIQQEGTNPRSDLYALAATLYHLMTGVTPPGALSRVSAIGGGRPDPLRPANQINPQINPAVASVLSWAMSIYSNQRPATAAAMREALRDAARSPAMGGSPYRASDIAKTVVASQPTNLSPPPAPTAPPQYPSSWPAAGHSLPQSQPPRKSKAVWWSLGLIGLLILIGAGTVAAILLLDQKPSGSSSISKSDSTGASDGSKRSGQSDSGYKPNDSTGIAQPDDVKEPDANSEEAAIDQILNRYVQAIGGREAVERVTSRVMKGSFQMPDLGLTGTTESYSKSPNKLLFIINVPGIGATRTGFDGRTGWSQDPQIGLRSLSGGELASLRRDADFYKFINLKRAYSDLALVGKQTINGREAYLIEATSDDGGDDRLYFDAETGLLIRSDNERETLQGAMTVENYYEDYKMVDGINIPFTVRQSSQIFRVIIRLREVRQNVSISDARFDMP